MMRRVWVVALACAFLVVPARAADEAARQPPLEIGVWTFEGPFGTYDRAALQRGYQVYKDVCAACHAMKQMSFRNLGEAGGPEMEAAQVKAIAAEFQVMDGPDEAGDMYERAGLPSDPFPSPFPNEKAARASNGGAHPPDLSLIVKRLAQEGGAEHVFEILTSYEEEAPEGVALDAGQYYTRAAGVIAMPPPLVEDGVEYADGTPAGVHQMAHDVTVFLAWASDPKMEVRKRVGFQVILYLLVLTGLLYAATRRIWKKAHEEEKKTDT